MTNKNQVTKLTDKNGVEIKTGQMVQIEGGYFKSDNGLFTVAHSPGDEDWLGRDYSLRKTNKNGTLSKSKYSIAFWPLSVVVSSRDKTLEAREHNKKHATITVVSETNERLLADQAAEEARKQKEVEEKRAQEIKRWEEYQEQLAKQERAEEPASEAGTAEEVEVIETQEAEGLVVEVSYNEEKNGIELKFDGKPSDEIRANLKSNGFRWSRHQRIWYAKDTEERRGFAKQFNSIITESEPKNFEYPEIDIDDLGNYTVSPELSRREHDSSWIFRTRERDHSGGLRSTLEHYQNEALKIIGLTNDKATIYYIKRDLQRFKKAYHSNFIALLTNRANNPSWAVTGRAGRNSRQGQKAHDRYGKLLEDYGEIKENFESQLRRHQGRIRRISTKNKFQQIENTDLEISFKVETKEVEYIGYKQTVRTYNHENYMIAKLWASYKIFRDGKEVPRHIIDLRTTDTLVTAKKAVQMLVNSKVINEAM